MNDLDTVLSYPKSAWYREHAAARPLMLSAVARPCVDGMIVSEYTILPCYFREGEIDWVPLLEDLDRIGQMMLEKYLEDEHVWKRQREGWMVYSNRIELIYRKLQKKDTRSLPDTELV